MKTITNYTIIFLKKNILLFSILFVSSFSLFGQEATVFIDDFNRSDVSPGGSPSLVYTIDNSGTAPVLIESNTHLRVTGGGEPRTGQAFITGNLSYFSAPYNVTLKLNTADSIIWTFNIRHNINGNLSGFGSGNRGCGVILTADNADLTLANGYAVVNGGESPSASRYRLVKFTGGLDANSKLVTLIVGQDLAGATNPGNNNRAAMSIRVVYIPATDTWKFYDRIDGASGVSDWKDPVSITDYLLAGSIVDNTYTGTVMQKFGFTVRYHLGSGTTSYNFWFDNLGLTLAGIQAPASTEARLSDIKVSTDNGTTYNSLMKFGADTYAYQYYLTKGQTLPLVSADKMHPAAGNPVIVQATSSDSTATISVTAEDGVTTANYSVKFIETDYVFISGLSSTADVTPAGWAAANIYFASSVAAGNSLYEGTTYARCIGNASSSHITLPATNSIGTLYFYARKIDGNAGTVKYSTKTGDADWIEGSVINIVESADYSLYSIDLNLSSTEDILVRIEITKDGADNSHAYYFDDFAYTAYDVGTSVANNELPVFDIQHIENGFKLYIKNAEVVVYNSMGMELKHSFVKNSETFNLPNKGIYILKINSNGKIFSEKILVR